MAQELERIRGLARPYAPKDRLASEELIAGAPREPRRKERMADAVLDSSAVLAVILEEPGAERVERYLPGGKVSAVNIGEIVAKLHDLGMPEPSRRGDRRAPARHPIP